MFFDHFNLMIVQFFDEFCQYFAILIVFAKCSQHVIVNLVGKNK
jgi:hypothetical protein